MKFRLKDLRDILIAVVLGLMFGIGARFATSTLHARAATLTCQDGEYDAGGFCRSIPTGCPYGDSIAVDSPKCAAPTENKTVTPLPAVKDTPPTVTPKQKVTSNSCKEQ